MRTICTCMLSLGILAVGLNCDPSGSTSGPRTDAQKPATAEKPALAAKPAPAEKPVLAAKPAPPKKPRSGIQFTPENNPTTAASRGEPSLEDFFRPPAWVYIDGKAGKFVEREGHPIVQWVIEGPVSSSPTFRVEAYAPLLGTPDVFACTLDTVEAAGGSSIAYGIKAAEGAFYAGYDYSLLDPGENFTVRNRLTGDVVAEIGTLVPGTYLIAAKVMNSKTGVEGLAITEFTVAEK